MICTLRIRFISSHLYKSFAFDTLNRITPSFRSAPVFLPPLYKSFAVETLNATFPFPHVFELRRLRGNPPCSLWLQSVHWTNCFTRRAHIAVPPCKGTHGNRVAGDNTRSRHNLRHFSYYATSPAWQLRNRTPRILVLFVKSDARCGRRLAAPIPSSKLHITFISAL